MQEIVRFPPGAGTASGWVRAVGVHLIITVYTVRKISIPQLLKRARAKGPIIIPEAACIHVAEI